MAPRPPRVACDLCGGTGMPLDGSRRVCPGCAGDGFIEHAPATEHVPAASSGLGLGCWLLIAFVVLLIVAALIRPR